MLTPLTLQPHHPHTSLVAANAEPVNAPSSSRVDAQDVQ